ncbi:MAG: hypothetical protein COX57_01595 [Alphaproteobacteria bacterium CG_4_10_14_0_2_um_filter_63_37]|nr:MAG: hypothetical protein AUJ55_12060 [Proteobacteria bacterium CG1_02_64_396]PJA25704.1 MAG: hypothetical protein COX57_01595 [Alphaproteobacteria bacterium CG_4_10_14_0_2_um_filter_63_37]
MGLSPAVVGGYEPWNTLGRGRMLHFGDDGDTSVEVREEGRYRWLTFSGGAPQSALDREEPGRLVFEHLHWLQGWMLFRDLPKRMLILGLGGGDLVRFALTALPETEIVAVEWSQPVIEAAHQFFHVPRVEPRLRVVQADAFGWVEQCQERFDVVLMDLFAGDLSPVDRLSVTWLTALQTILTPDGAVALNLIPGRAGDTQTVARRLRIVFGGEAYTLTAPRSGNLVMLAFPWLARRAAQSMERRGKVLQVRLGIDFKAMVRRLRADNPGLS